eukprot:6480040-Amphidinium_carterae.2
MAVDSKKVTALPGELEMITATQNAESTKIETTLLRDLKGVRETLVGRLQALEKKDGETMAVRRGRTQTKMEIVILHRISRLNNEHSHR